MFLRFDKNFDIDYIYYAALRTVDLDWIVGLGISLGRYIFGYSGYLGRMMITIGHRMNLMTRGQMMMTTRRMMMMTIG